MFIKPKWLLAVALLLLNPTPVHSADADTQPVLIVKTSDARGDQLRQFMETESDANGMDNLVQFLEPIFPEDTWGANQTNFPVDRYFTVRLKPGASAEEAVRALGQKTSVESVQIDYEMTDPHYPTPNDPHFKDQWYLRDLKIVDAWDTTRGEGIFVADVESGFDTKHPDIVHQFDLKKSHDYDPQAKDPDKIDGNKRSHGTPVTGIIAAEADNGLFGCGIAFQAKLIGSQMADSMETHTKEDLWTVNTAKAILGSIDRGASVILVEKQIPSLFSSVERVKIIYDAVKAAVDAGVTVVLPAGNYASELKAEADQPDTGSILVGATLQEGSLAYFSNYGERVNVSAPGENIYTIQENNGEIFDFGGTSSASAIAAGVAALVRAANPKLTPREVRQILVDTGKRVTKVEGAGNLFASVLETFQSPSVVIGGNPFARQVGPLLQAGPAVKKAIAQINLLQR